MPKVTPLHVDLQSACRAGEAYLRAHRPQDTSDLAQRRAYRKAVEALQEQIATTGATKVSTATPRQRRAIYVWIMEHLPDGFGS